MSNLNIIVKKAQKGNKQCITEVVNTFLPLIKKYSKKLNYDDAYNDLILCLIEIIKNIPIVKSIKFEKDKYIVGYIDTSIKHSYIQLSKKNTNIINKEIKVDINILSNYRSTENWNSIDNNIFVYTLMDKLSNYQKYIIKKIFIYNVSEADLAKELNISRQAINKTKNRALNILKKFAIK